ncbi:MAG TPA: ankyrin repeat domain-containing protein [Kofleriaceae bacterium]|nr:ankyrin repeat domain-containing protein [Kofleriaceae bacterium]
MRAIAAVLAIGCGAPEHAAQPPAASDELHVAIWRGDEAVVARLVAAGADINAQDAHKRPAWFYAVLAHDAHMLDLLRGPLTGDDVDRRVSVDMAVASNDVAIVRRLLANHFGLERANGTPTLAIAAANGLPEMMTLLLEHGAPIDARDREGDSAVVAAQRAGCDACVEVLRAHGAAIAAPPAVPAPTELPSIRDSLARSVPLVVREGAHWMQDPGCESCHHQPMALQVIALAEQRGIALDRAQADRVREMMRADDARFARDVFDPIANDDAAIVRASMEQSGDFAFANAWFLSAMIDAGEPHGHAEEVAARIEAAVQQPDGHWRHGPTRGALESTDLVATALAARVIAVYAPGTATAARVAAAGRWLVAATPATTLDRVYKLNGLAWTHADPELVADAAADLRAHQLTDGSWSHIGTVGDAFTTGLALVALQRSGGIAPTDPVYQRGIAFLLRTQQADGSWLVPSRAAPLLKYFDSGFPHGRHQFISYAGTAAASLALMLALPAS